MSSYTSSSCQHFDFLEIQLATENFNESLVVGRGGFGKVYAGTIFNGSSSITVAIKRLDNKSNQGPIEFWAEVEMLTKLRHCNLVSLIGYCNYNKEMILVYEYMPNGTLSDHLHELGTSLSWLQRLKICIGAARGLQYLHTGTGIEFGVIHRDVKSSNILLHESWAAKISDFGLSKIGPTNQPSTGVSTAVKGTFGYLDPDYYATGKLTRKSDVYAFGVVLLEMLCRKRAVDKSLDQDQWNLARWAQESIKAGNLRRIIDPDIGGQIYPKCLKEFVRIAERCLHNNPQKRSTMAEVVVSLESVLALQEKINSSFQASGKTIFGRIVDRLYFPYNGEQLGRIVDRLYFPYNGEHTGTHPSLELFLHILFAYIPTSKKYIRI
ncbi:Concanavalin A-like lectin/glucanase, subgroup [Artemisia annua]|uniref:Concanavalin A-like lectin/glucanase, subgroup n=1 Tax=Artemisia annua TaxID=35608 RepID=A0A2U1QET5_ARTAN|nr:Concanavalin A-like lectin/glucanase, subgroup [Artemisia annua]